jgi:outer membrane protein insertion porin family
MFSASASDEVIKKILVQGVARTDEATVLSYSGLEVGQHYNDEVSDQSLKKLYATGFFSNVTLSIKDGVVRIVIQESPIISGIYFSGNKSLKSDQILSELSLHKRSYFSEAKLREDVNKITELYSKLGKFAAIVTPKVSKLPQNRIDVLFEIQEGSKMKIERISFVGNKKFSSNDLRQAMFSKENRLFNILRPTHYSADAIEYDKMSLRRFYNSRGYADFRIISVNVETAPGKMDKAYITFVVDEGALYHFDKVLIQNKIEAISNATLLNLQPIKAGAVFDSSAVEDLNNHMIRYLAEHGFPFVHVEYDYLLNKQKKTVDVTYKISKGAKVYIGKINIGGNHKTYDYVIRREFRLVEGDPYNGFLVDRSEQRIRNLDYFDKVSLSPVKTGKSDVVDIDVKVTEKSTANLKFSGGYSTSDGPLVSINFTEINWLGQGKHLSTNIQKTVFTTGLSFGVSEPHFMGTEVEIGLSAGFSSEKNNAKGLAKLGANHSDMPFNEEKYTAMTFMGYDIMEYLNYNLDYSVIASKTTPVGNTQNNVPLRKLLDLGRHLTSALGHTFTYNKADSAIKPKKGYIITFSQSLAGLGGDVRNMRHILKGAHYYPITENLVFKLGVEGGLIHRITNKTSVRISDNFYLGDFSFRGFDYAGVGARDKKTEDSLGSLRYYKGIAELQFPLPGIPKDVDLTTSVFADLGSAWGVDIPGKLKSVYTREMYNDKNAIRATVGIGFIWITQMGPLRIDFAKALKKEKFDKTKVFLFSYSTAL